MRLHPLGDGAVLIQLGDTIDEATHRRVQAVCARLEEQPVPGMIEYVPAYASVAVHYDPMRLPEPPYDSITAALRAALASLSGSEPPASRLIEIPVCYGGDAGPDLAEVARFHGLTEEEVVRIHAGAEYRVHMIGFAPGFPYLGGMDPRIATPRRLTPRTLVPASSVGIGGRQTGIYSIPSPGGWHLIGRTPLRLFDPAAEPPSLLRAGDRVRFRPITGNELSDAARAL